MTVDLQAKVESNPVGRAAITGLLIFILGSLVAANAPTSYVQLKLNEIVRPVRDGVGLDQTWSVFAPEPRRQVYGLEARIVYDDGTTKTWSLPHGDPWITPYRTYHWQKWSEFARADDAPSLWQPFAAWIARAFDAPARHPVLVTLVRRWYDLYPPGSHPSRGPWQEYAYYSLPVTSAVLRGDA